MATKIGLVGVPTRVATPPIEAENEMPRRMDLKKLNFLLPESSLISLINAPAMVTIISVVAVFDIHMERNPVAKINPRRIPFALLPTFEMIVRAILL